MSQIDTSTAMPQLTYETSEKNFSTVSQKIIVATNADYTAYSGIAKVQDINVIHNNKKNRMKNMWELYDSISQGKSISGGGNYVEPIYTPTKHENPYPTCGYLPVYFAYGGKSHLCVPEKRL